MILTITTNESTPTVFTMTVASIQVEDVQAAIERVTAAFDLFYPCGVTVSLV